MAYDSNRAANSGDTKLSELAVDRTLPVFDTSGPQTNALVALEVAMKALAEVIRKTNYILRSQGQIFWDGSDIRFDDGAVANHAFLEILATEGVVNPSFALRMQGSTVGNGPSTFRNIPLADGELIYMELSSALFIDQGTSFDLDNAINGGGTTVGQRLLKTTVAAGMPKLRQDSAGGTVFNIPLVMRRGSDIWWIPHGIRWPIGTVSTLGAVIVEGVEPWPNRFAENEAQLDSAITACAAAGGGIILLKGSFSINNTKTIPTNTKVLGRGGGSTIAPFQSVTMNNGSKFLLSGNFSSMEHVNMIAGAAFTGTMVDIQPGFGNTVEYCNLDLTATTDVSTNRGITMAGSGNRCYRNFIRGVNTNRIGVFYAGGSDNTDVDTFTYT